MSADLWHDLETMHENVIIKIWFFSLFFSVFQCLTLEKCVFCQVLVLLRLVKLAPAPCGLQSTLSVLSSTFCEKWSCALSTAEAGYTLHTHKHTEDIIHRMASSQSVYKWYMWCIASTSTLTDIHIQRACSGASHANSNTQTINVYVTSWTEREPHALTGCVCSCLLLMTDSVFLLRLDETHVNIHFVPHCQSRNMFTLHVTDWLNVWMHTGTRTALNIKGCLLVLLPR